LLSLAAALDRTDAQPASEIDRTLVSDEAADAETARISKLPFPKNQNLLLDEFHTTQGLLASYRRILDPSDLSKGMDSSKERAAVLASLDKLLALLKDCAHRPALDQISLAAAGLTQTLTDLNAPLRSLHMSPWQFSLRSFDVDGKTPQELCATYNAGKLDATVMRSSLEALGRRIEVEKPVSGPRCRAPRKLPMRGCSAKMPFNTN
jgi:hypothetical protein